MKTPSWFPAAFGFAMLGLGVGGYVWLRRQNQGVLGDGLGRSKIKLDTRQAEAPPLLETTREGGMTVRHYRLAGMPIERRVSLIQDLVWKSIHDPRMRRIALGLTRKCPERDGMCEARAIYDAVKRRVRYTGDIAPVKMPNGGVEGVDYFQSAWRTWEIGGGDCDDAVILVSTLLALNGITPRLRVTTAKKGEDPSHIYAVAGVNSKVDPKKWIALDVTLPGKNKFNVEAPFAHGTDFTVRDVPA